MATRGQATEKVGGTCTNDALQDFTREELRKAIGEYKIQIDELKNQIHTLKSDKPDFVIRKENINLQKRNKILVSTNAGMSRQVTNLMTQMSDQQKRNEDLQTQLNIIQSNSDSHTQALGDHSALEENNTKLKDEIVQMRSYLKYYFNESMKYQQENKKLLKDMQDYDTQKTSCNKLLAEVSLVVKERDYLKEKLEIAQNCRANFPATNNEMTDEAKKQCEMLEERCRVTEAEKAKYEESLASKDYHITEQETKIENLMKKLDIYGRLENEVNHLQLQIKMLEEQKKKLEEKNENLNTAKHDEEFVQQQLKAFQDDWSAENEEKAQIMEEKRKLENDNKLLRKQLSETHPFHQYQQGPYGCLSPQSPPAPHQQSLDPEYAVPNPAIVPSQSPLVPSSSFAPAQVPSSQVYNTQPFRPYLPEVHDQYQPSHQTQPGYYGTSNTTYPHSVPHSQFIRPRYPLPHDVTTSFAERNVSNENNYAPNQPARRRS